VDVLRRGSIAIAQRAVRVVAKLYGAAVSDQQHADAHPHH
jgi:hypothetical protein